MGAVENNEDGCLSRFNFLDKFGSEAMFNVGGEDAHKTVVGALWSCIFLLGLLGSLTYYFYLYAWRINPGVVVNFFKEDDHPVLDISNHNFFLSFYVKEKGAFKPLSAYKDTLFDIDVHYTTKTQTSTHSQDDAEVVKTKLDVAACPDTSIKASTFHGKVTEAISEDATCIKFSKGTELTGDDSSTVFKFVEINLVPCDKSKTTCMTRSVAPGAHLGDPLLQAAFKEMRKLELYVNFIEPHPDMENYSDPLKYGVNSRNQLRIDLFKQKVSRLYFHHVELETVTGLIIDSSSTITTIEFAERIDGQTTRDPGTDDLVIPGHAEAKAAEYFKIVLLSTSEKKVYTRTYAKLIDVFSNVGGVSQVIGFLVAIAYTWYSSVSMEQTFINQGYLAIDNEDVEQIRSEDQKPFTFWEIFMVQYCSCCLQKRKRKEFYYASNDTITERTDLLHFIANQGIMMSMAHMFYKPYQVKLLSIVKVDRELDDILEEMSLEQAFAEMNDKEKKKSPKDEMIDSWIMRNLEPNALKRLQSDNSEVQNMGRDVFNPEIEDPVQRGAFLNEGKISYS